MENRLYPNLILEALKNVRYPGNGKNIVEAQMVADDIRIDGNKVSFSLVFEKPTDPFAKSLVKAAEAALKTFVGEFVEPTVSMTFLKQTPAAVKNVLPGVKNIIGVSSGKGGVGKPGVCQAALLHHLWLRGHAGLRRFTPLDGTYNCFVHCERDGRYRI